MFTMERLNHFKTEVYGDRCVFFSVDTLSAADKMEKVKNGLKFERFDVFPDFFCAQSARPALNEERQRSSVGFVRFLSARAVQTGSPETPYLPAIPNEFPSLLTVVVSPVAFEHGCSAVFGRPQIFASAFVSSPARPEGDLNDIRRARPVRHRLCKLTHEPAGGRMARSPDGNIARLRHKPAERQLDEEMTQ